MRAPVSEVQGTSVTRNRPSAETSTLASLWILLSGNDNVGVRIANVGDAFASLAQKSQAWMRYVRWALSDTCDSAFRRQHKLTTDFPNAHFNYVFL
jgi:hypothetical protein